jgi:hypothetical protein
MIAQEAAADAMRELSAGDADGAEPPRESAASSPRRAT